MAPCRAAGTVVKVWAAGIQNPEPLRLLASGAGPRITPGAGTSQLRAPAPLLPARSLALPAASRLGLQHGPHQPT